MQAPRNHQLTKIYIKKQHVTNCLKHEYSHIHVHNEYLHCNKALVYV